MSNQNKPKPISFDPVWMNRLLNEPEVKPKLAGMSSKKIEGLKRILVQTGTYHRYIAEKQRDEMRALIGLPKAGN